LLAPYRRGSAFALQGSILVALQSSPSPETPLRVALFSGNYNYVMDGPVRALNMLVGRLLDRGHEALIFAPTSRTPALKHTGELVSAPSVALPGSRSEYRFSLGMGSAARRRLEEFSPSIIHVAAPDLLGRSALRWAAAHGLPAVASFHTRFDTYPRYYGLGWLEPQVTAYMRRFYARCARVYAPSQSMADELAADGIGRDIRLWARGVDKTIFNPGRRDLQWRRSLGIEDDVVVVAFVGRLVKEKGIDLFADCYARARARTPKLRALIVGEGPERARFEALAPDAVFIGYQQGEGLGRAYASADIFVNPSITETFGNVTLEAMACGLPSICAAASGSKSLIAHGESGLLVDPRAAATGYADAIERLAANAEVRAAFGGEARRKADAFDWNAILDGLIADYRAVIREAADKKPYQN
jgi:glycosyltransferase involved in cell wall biosynthesis